MKRLLAIAVTALSLLLHLVVVVVGDSDAGSYRSYGGSSGGGFGGFSGGHK